MNQSDTEQKSTSGSLVINTESTRFSRAFLIIARIVWLALVVPSLGLFVVSLPVSYQQLQQPHSPSGNPGSGVVVLSIILSAVSVAIWCGIGFLIFWRRSDDWVALLTAFVLVMYYITFLGVNSSFAALVLTYPVLIVPLNLLSFLGQVSLGVFLLLFPNGRLVPRWMWLILLLIIIQTFLGIFPSPSSPLNESNWPEWLNLLGVLIPYGAIIASQIYRYRRVSTPVQRQQTKWVVFGGTAAIGVLIGLIFIGFLIPSLLNTPFWNAVWSLILPIALFLIPVSIGFSMMRYRLYDIDVLINRTLVYGTLTVLLALVYAGLIFGLQYLLRGIISQNNDVAIVVSTLAIVALFQPLRHRIQAIIDRRFYRSKYDAVKTLEAFSATLRNEVDLNQLQEHLLNVVQETMQPAHVSLWLRQPTHRTTPSLQIQTSKAPTAVDIEREQSAGHGV